MSALSRRRFVHGTVTAGLAVLGACALPPVLSQSRSSERPHVPRVGYLAGATRAAGAQNTAAFRQGLSELGYVEGHNILTEERWAESQAGALPALAAELVALPADVIVSATNAAHRVLLDATSNIPIVMATSGDPVAEGLVASLARPGGNITGLTSLNTPLARKRLELLKQAVPRATRVAVLWNPEGNREGGSHQEVAIAADVLNVEVFSLQVRRATDLEDSLAVLNTSGCDALIVLSDFLLVANRGAVVRVAESSGLPGMFDRREFAVAGGLMAYGPRVPDLYRRAAYYVDRLLKGAQPAELPIEQPMTYDFSINMNTAQALGLTIPQHVLLQATEVIQ